MARLVNIFAHRLQVQERMTDQIADAFARHVKPKAVGVLIRARHGCMSSRGVRIHGTVTTTCALRGELKRSEALRAEFLGLCRDAEKTRL
jgi:GTP cyclohydrolase I